MADKIPLKLVDQGGGAGQLEEFAAGDKIPNSNLNMAGSSSDSTPGLIPYIGWGGLASAQIPIMTNADLDTLLLSGPYYCTGSNPGAPLTSGSFLIEVFGATDGSGRTTQRATQLGIGSLRIWQRSAVSGVFPPAWTELWHSGNLVKQASPTDATAARVLLVGAGGLLGDCPASDPDTAGLPTGFSSNPAVDSLNSQAGVFITVKYQGIDRKFQLGANISGSERYVCRTQLSNGAWLPTRTLWHSAGANLVTVDTGSLGYGTGSGGTAPQTTSKASGVTLNKLSGKITTTADALAAGARTSFVLTSNKISVGDSIVPMLAGGAASSIAYKIYIVNVVPNGCRIAIENVSAGSLSEALDITFVVIKGAAA